MSEQVPAQSADQAIAERLVNYLEQPEEAPEEAPQDTPTAEDVREVDVTEQEEAPAEQENTITIDPDAAVFEIEIKAEGGKNETKQVSLTELQNGYMRYEDYHRKTQEISKARDQLAVEAQQLIEPERQAYVQNLQQLQHAVMSMVAPEFQNVNWEQLAAEDPAGYVKLSAKAQKAQQTMMQFQQQITMAQQQAMQQQAEQSKRVLSDPVQGIAGWGPELYTTLINDASKLYGYKPEEVANVVDHRAIKVLHDAYQYRKLQEAKPTVEKKISAAPKVMKPGKPVDEADTQAKQHKELMAQFKKGGGKDLRAAANLLLARQRKA